MENLAQQKCKPCEGGVASLSRPQFENYLGQVPDWAVVGDKMIERLFQFKNFAQALEFVNKVGTIAESEGHHPDIFLHGWNKVKITLRTHAIGGLSLNDFIVARKIDEIKV
jgi:4a-hydroxytetrahydrobiopterin dehydratase